MIKVGFCVAYDWEFLKNSLPRVYDGADVICLALDKDRHSWACNPFEFDAESFYRFVKKIDKNGKIDVYEDDFSLPDLNARENCNRHRTMIAERLGPGGWHVQVDSDEYFLDFGSFVENLKKIYKNPTGAEQPVNVCCPIIPLFKKTKNGYLIVSNENRLPEMFPMASNKPRYERARHNGYFNIYTTNWVVHETWAREKEGMLFKLKNWGHAAEELKKEEFALGYFQLWESLNEFNHQFIRDFHPASPKVWPALSFIPGNDIQEFLGNFIVPDFPLSKFKLKLKNSIHYSRLSKFFPFLKVV